MADRRFTKAEKKELRRLAQIAYERDLSAATEELDADFRRWRKGEIDVFELNQRIHKFHNGPSRNLYKFYVMGSDHWVVATAITDGVIKESEVQDAIMEGLKGSLELARYFAQKNADQ